VGSFCSRPSDREDCPRVGSIRWHPGKLPLRCPGYLRGWSLYRIHLRCQQFGDWGHKWDYGHFCARDIGNKNQSAPDSINSPWPLTGPDSYNQSGAGDHTLISPAVGDYTLTWGDVSGWFKPAPVLETKAVTDGATTTFDGMYVQITTPGSQVTPGSLNFGYVPVGSTKDLTLTVRNTGIGTLTGSATTAAPFRIVSGGSYNLVADQEQAVTIRYQPTSSG